MWWKISLDPLYIQLCSLYMYQWQAEYQLDVANTDKNGSLESFSFIVLDIPGLKHDWKKYITNIKMHPKYIRSGTQTILPIIPRQSLRITRLTHLGLVSHIYVMKNSSHFPSDAYMRHKYLFFSYSPRGRPIKQVIYTILCEEAHSNHYPDESLHKQW